MVPLSLIAAYTRLSLRRGAVDVDDNIYVSGGLALVSRPRLVPLSLPLFPRPLPPRWTHWMTSLESKYIDDSLLFLLLPRQLLRLGAGVWFFGCNLILMRGCNFWWRLIGVVLAVWLPG